MKEKRPLLSRDYILTKALDLINEKGIKVLSMRNLGKALGVEAMSLYNHVSNKDEILSGVLDMIVNRISIPDEGSDWCSAIKEYALSARSVFKKYPWATALMNSHLGSGPSRLNYYDTMIRTFCQAGFSLEQAARSFSLIDSYIYGFLLQLDNLDTADQTERSTEKERISKFSENTGMQNYPYLEKMTKWAMENNYDSEKDFEFGIDLILSALKRMLS
ncbi:MAG: TetR/AcrR family transcriptional regulator C-terminal domain-containing protein [Bacteroidales bacterium]|nr:TetR/AcrR family transcriptional regulator C-terminal domain-containing protein [Bacteroidales bacterium]